MSIFGGCWLIECKKDSEIKRIKKIMIECTKLVPGNDLYHLVHSRTLHAAESNLNWHRYEKHVKMVAAMLPKNIKVLDVGCGWSHTTAMLRVLRPDLKVTGVEMYKAITWKKLKKYGCEFAVCSGEALSFKDKEFGAVLSFTVLEHVNNANKFLEEIFRVLDNGGYNFIFGLPNKYGLSEAIGARILGFIFHKKQWRHEVKYTRKKVENLLSKTGFIDIDIEKEFLIPTEVLRISPTLDRFFNRNYMSLNRLDEHLTKTPLRSLCQTFRIYCRKR